MENILGSNPLKEEKSNDLLSQIFGDEKQKIVQKDPDERLYTTLGIRRKYKMKLEDIARERGKTKSDILDKILEKLLT
jgi:hypothetical protein